MLRIFYVRNFRATLNQKLSLSFNFLTVPWFLGEYIWGRRIQARSFMFFAVEGQISRKEIHCYPIKLACIEDIPFSIKA